MRSKEEIEDQVAASVDSKDENGAAGKWPGMSYEDGVEAALMWVLEERDEAPMED